MLQVGDITKLSGEALPPVDVVTGGSPCQDLSVAGVRKGLSGERSGLFLEQVRVVRELREEDGKRGRTGQSIRPRFMLWENVPGAFSSNGGRDFQTVLQETIRIAQPDAPDVPRPKKWPMADAYFGDGWSIAYRVFDAQFWGVPQRRRRICLVADFGGFAAPEILFVRDSLSGDTAAGGAAREETAGAVESGAYPAIERTLTASPRIDGGSETIAQVIPINDKATRYQGGGATRNGDGSGNGLGVGKDGDPCFTLTSADRHAVYDARGNAPFIAIGLDSEHNACAERYGTLRAHGSGGAEGAVMVAVNCRDGTETAVNGTLQANGNSLNANVTVRQNGVVRRLTPLECERLQGFPDGWTDIGPWEDSRGWRRECSDTARYRALGNSIALPPWRWVLKRIRARYGRDATLGSLFDGIGGFPLIWEELNGEGSCIWASEIEEFCIAVTNRRFSRLP